MKTNAVLPAAEVDALRSLYADSNRDPLRARVLSLRSKNWPLRAIGDPLGVSRMGVRGWQLQAQEDPDLTQLAATLDTPALPLDARGVQVVERSIPSQIPTNVATRLRELAPEVRKLRGRTAPDSPVRTAVQEYDEIIDTYVNRRNVTPMDVARAAGVTRRAIAVHLERIAARRAHSATSSPDHSDTKAS